MWGESNQNYIIGTKWQKHHIRLFMRCWLGCCDVILFYFLLLSSFDTLVDTRTVINSTFIHFLAIKTEVSHDNFKHSESRRI